MKLFNDKKAAFVLALSPLVRERSGLKRIGWRVCRDILQLSPLVRERSGLKPIASRAALTESAFLLSFARGVD